MAIGARVPDMAKYIFLGPSSPSVVSNKAPDPKVMKVFEIS